METTTLSQGRTEEISFRNTVGFPSTTWATFGLYQYPAKFIPHVVAWILKNYARPGTKVFDPFAGCGTVGVVSRIYGCNYELWDLNPMLEILHKVATMKPVNIEIKDVLEKIGSSKDEFIPDWKRMDYWFPRAVLPFLYRIWGYYHSLDDISIKTVLTVPLLRTTRQFSYDDMQRQKLSKSGKSLKRVEVLLSGDWRKKFMQMLEREIERVLNAVDEYYTLHPADTEAIIRAGVDVLEEDLNEERDILITSPPYLQSQEYIRQAKLDLYWLGYSEEKVRQLQRLEIPYRTVEPFPVKSRTFLEYQSRINEPHIRRIFNQYFWGVLRAMTTLQDKISSYLFLFVGHSSTRGHSVPIDRIFVEHLSGYGWEHECTLVDRIVSRRLFAYGVNPASGLRDMRTSVENLVILKRG
jgi:hypothetical protein